MPIVSIVLPNFNHAFFLQERINSVLNQTYQDFELIILDDCSTDNSREIIELFRNHPKVSHVVFNEQNSGTTFKQWNKGMALAQGKYIWIAESDDSCHPQFLEKLMAVLNAHPEVCLAFANSQRMDASGTLHNLWTDNYHGETTAFLKKDFVLPGSQVVTGPMLFLNAIPNASSALFLKEAALAAGPAPEEFRLVGDWAYWVRILMQGDVAFLAEPLNYFRFHEQTVRNNSQKQGQGLLEILDVMAMVKAWQKPDEKTEDLAVTYLLYTWQQIKKSGALDFKTQFRIYKKAVGVFPSARLAVTKEFIRILF